MATLGTEESGRCGEVAVMVGVCYGKMQHVSGLKV